MIIQPVLQPSSQLVFILDKNSKGKITGQPTTKLIRLTKQLAYGRGARQLNTKPGVTFSLPQNERKIDYPLSYDRLDHQILTRCLRRLHNNRERG